MQQIAVKLYEKDPSKLTSVDEPLPTVSTSSDLSDEEDSNLDAGPAPPPRGPTSRRSRWRCRRWAWRPT